MTLDKCGVMIPNIVLKTFVSLRFLCDERIFAIGVAGGTDITDCAITASGRAELSAIENYL